MNYRLSLSGLVSLAVLLFFGIFASAAYSATMKVEADIYRAPVDDDTVRISVPDIVDLGSVTLYDQSEEVRLWINNTGTVDVIVTPQLADEQDEIFSNLYFRPQKTSNGTDVEHRRIGDFFFEARKPTGSSSSNPEDIYMILDLRNFTGILTRDLIDERADIYFVAVEA